MGKFIEGFPAPADVPHAKGTMGGCEAGADPEVIDFEAAIMPMLRAEKWDRPHRLPRALGRRDEAATEVVKAMLEGGLAGSARVRQLLRGGRFRGLPGAAEVVVDTVERFQGHKARSARRCWWESWFPTGS